MSFVVFYQTETEKKIIENLVSIAQNEFPTFSFVSVSLDSELEILKTLQNPVTAALFFSFHSPTPAFKNTAEALLRFDKPVFILYNKEEGKKITFQIEKKTVFYIGIDPQKITIPVIKKILEAIISRLNQGNPETVLTHKKPLLKTFLKIIAVDLFTDWIIDTMMDEPDQEKKEQKKKKKKKQTKKILQEWSH